MTILTVFRIRLRSKAEAAHDTLVVEMSQLASETPSFLDEKTLSLPETGSASPSCCSQTHSVMQRGGITRVILRLKREGSTSCTWKIRFTPQRLVTPAP